jgi:hypothetical protein
MVQSSKSSKCVSFGPSRKITLNGSGNREDGGNDFTIYIVPLLTNEGQRKVNQIIQKIYQRNMVNQIIKSDLRKEHGACCKN